MSLPLLSRFSRIIPPRAFGTSERLLTTRMTMVNSLEASRNAIIQQVKFDILTETHDVVCILYKAAGKDNHTSISFA